MTALVKVGEDWFEQYSDEHYNALNNREGTTPQYDTAKLIAGYFIPRIVSDDPKGALLYAVARSGLRMAND